MIDETRQELAALYVFGGLEADEAKRFADELCGDAELRAFVHELEETAAQLAHAAPLCLPPAELKQRVLAEAAGEKRTMTAAPRTNWIPWALAASLAVSCGLFWRERGQFDREHRATQQELAATRLRGKKDREILNGQLAEALARQGGEIAALQKEIADLRAHDALAVVKIQTLSAQVDTYAKALAVVIWDESSQRGVLKLDKFPKAGAGKDYQLWVIDPNKKAPVSAGVVPVGVDGVARVAFQPGEHIDAAQKFAISVERTGGAPAPAGQIVVIGN